MIFVCQRGERQPLLDAFDRFLEETDPTYLGVAMDGSNWFSKLVFYWVNPLMEKGVRGKLQSPDDLFDLPLQLTCSSVSLKLDKALIGNVDEVQKKILQQRLHGKVFESGFPIGLEPVKIGTCVFFVNISWS